MWFERFSTLYGANDIICSLLVLPKTMLSAVLLSIDFDVLSTFFYVQLLVIVFG